MNWFDSIYNFLEKLFSKLSPNQIEGDNGEMRISHEGINMLTMLEANVLYPYDDKDKNRKPIKSWCKGATIGIGHLICKAEWGKYKNGISTIQSEILLTQDLKRFEKAINETIKLELNQQQFDALCMLTFNIGVAGFKGSSVVKMINDPKAKTSYRTLEDAWKAWNKSDGHVVIGLINRRKKEWTLYGHGAYN